MQDPRIDYLSKDTASSVSADEAIVQDQDDPTCKELLAPEVSKYYALRSPALDIVIQKYAVYITSNAAWSLVDRTEMAVLSRSTSSTASKRTGFKCSCLNMQRQ